MNSEKAKALHEKAVEVTKSYRKAESELIEVLQEFDKTKAFRYLGYKSLFEYGVKALGFPEYIVYNLITISRKAFEIPELKEKLQSQKMTITNARLIAPVLNKENKDQWLIAAETLSKRELEKQIAKEFPKQAVSERAHYVSEKRLELRMGISEELFYSLKRAQELISTQRKELVSLEQVIGVLTNEYLGRKDPLEKAKRAKTKSEPPVQPERPKPSSHTRPHLDAKTRHQLILRDQHQCTFLDEENRRCSERKWLDFHHIRPRSKGGRDEPSNLTLLCKGHHQLIHARGG